MKYLTFTCFIALFTMTESSSVIDGMAYGFISSNIGRKMTSEPKKVTLEYYNFTIDTSLQEFPPNYYPQCITQKKHIVVPPLTDLEIMFGTIFVSVIFCIVVNCTEEDRVTSNFLTGYMLGRFIESMVNEDSYSD